MPVFYSFVVFALSLFLTELVLQFFAYLISAISSSCTQFIGIGLIFLDELWNRALLRDVFKEVIVKVDCVHKEFNLFTVSCRAAIPIGRVDLDLFQGVPYHSFLFLALIKIMCQHLFELGLKLGKPFLS